MRKEKIIQVCFLLLFSFIIKAGNGQNKSSHTFLLTGASFAASVNGWFELGCEHLGVEPINKAIGGTSIAELANLMSDNKLYSVKELDELDALIIMHVVDRDVFDETNLKGDYQDYYVPFKRDNFPGAFDYVIKRYISDCYNLKNNRNSKYYQSKEGKIPFIVLCTNWHDGREKYNTSIRNLANKWNFPLIEFDKMIGFTKKTPHPVTKDYWSSLYAMDSQNMDGDEKQGWHPKRGKDQYIQRRMASIFADTMKKYFLF